MERGKLIEHIREGLYFFGLVALASLYGDSQRNKTKLEKEVEMLNQQISVKDEVLRETIPAYLNCSEDMSQIYERSTSDSVNTLRVLKDHGSKAKLHKGGTLEILIGEGVYTAPLTSLPLDKVIYNGSGLTQPVSSFNQEDFESMPSLTIDCNTFKDISNLGIDTIRIYGIKNFDGNILIDSNPNFPQEVKKENN